MEIGLFGGVNLYEPEGINPHSSSWNSNCFYDKGKLIFQKYLVEKNPILTEMYEREYFNKTTVDAGGAELDVYETGSYRVKGKLSYEHDGDGVGTWEHGIPKPSVRVHFDYSNDPSVPEHYHNILDKLREEQVIDKGYYDAIVSNLEDSDMVSDCEIAVSYSGPYGESGLTIFKIANYIPYFFLEIPLFKELNSTDSYERFKNIKYLNVYVKYNFMTDYLLINRYNFDTDGRNQEVGYRNRYTNLGGHGMDFRYPFIEYKALLYPLLQEPEDGEDDTRVLENVLWFSSGLFAYESEEKPALQWFVPNRITSNAPMLVTELQTYVAEDDDEETDDSTYQSLKEFWNENAEDDIDYDSGDDIIISTEYISATISDPDFDSEDRSKTKYQEVEYKNNFVQSVDRKSKTGHVYEAGSFSTNYTTKGSVFAVITHQLAEKDSSAEDGMSTSPQSQVVVFEKNSPGSSRRVRFDGIGKASRDSMTFEVVINKYHEVGNKRIFVETINLFGTAKFFDFELRNCVFDDTNDDNQYIYQVWLKNSDIDGGWMLIQEVDFKSWKDYKDAADDRYRVSNEKYIYTYNSHKPSYSLKTKGNITVKVDHDVGYDCVYTEGIEHKYYHSYNSSGYDNADIYHRARQKSLIAGDVSGIYRLYGTGAIDTGGNASGRDGGFASIAEFYHDGEWKLYIGFNPIEIVESELYSDFQASIDLTIQSIDYNYDELYEIIKYGVAIEGPNIYQDMIQKETVSKHEVYMDRLFKTIDNNDNDTSLMYFSEQSFPETFSPSSLFKFEKKVVHLETYRHKLYIFMTDRIKVLSGSNSLTFILDKYYSDGAYEWTVVEGEDVLYFTNEKGMYRINGGYPERISEGIQKLFDEKLIDPDYAEILHSEKCGDFYVLNLNTVISPMAVGGVGTAEFSKLLETGSTSDNGLGWYQSKSSDFYEDADKRFSIDKIAVSLRTGEIWFGTAENTEEFLWKSSEMFHESIFLNKKIKQMALDFSGKVKAMFTKHRSDPVTMVELPLVSSAVYLDEPNYNDYKSKKGSPTFHNVAGETVFSYNILFLSLDNDSELFRWGVTANDY